MQTATVQPAHFRNTHRVEKLVASKLFWVLAISFFFGYPVIKSIRRQLPSALPEIGTAPAFVAINEEGKTFGTEDLKGKVYVAHFMSSQCGGQCALSLKQMQTVQHRLRGVIDRAAILSFTIDSENDRPGVLYGLARELNANPTVWRFLSATGVAEGFKMPMESGATAHTGEEALKSNMLVLVDQDGIIRGYYPIEKAGINRLMIDTGLLINRKKNS